MGAVSNLPDWLRAVLALADYSVLFAQTIRRNHANRPIVLAVCTVIVWVVFLIAATLRGQPLFRAVVTFATIGLGFLVLFLLARMFSAGRGVKHHLEALAAKRRSPQSI
jgi:hypothetical protein